MSPGVSGVEQAQLRALGPLEHVDAALLLVRRGGGDAFLRGLLAGTPLALLVLAIYYLERVEGVRALRPAFAVLLVLAYLLRGLWLSRVAQHYALRLRPSLPLGDAPRPVDVAGTVLLVGLGLWCWLWLPVSAAIMSPFAILGVWPLLALRGAVAPSWLARARCQPEGGTRALGQAFDDTHGMRGVFATVELLVLLGAVGAFGNLYALCSLALLLAHSMVGLDTALVSTFLSPDNTLVPLFVACLTLVLMEPLRAALSAEAYVHARSRHDGADLHAAVDGVIEAGRRRRQPGRRTPSTAALALIVGTALCSGVAQPATAQAPELTADAPPLEARSGDAEVRDEVATILARHEFREFAEQDNRAVADLIERFFRWLDRMFEGERGSATEPSDLPRVPGWLLMALALAGIALIVGYVYAQRRANRGAAIAARGDSDGQAVREPEQFLDEASRLAQLGDPRAALRALYVATLVTLDRQRLIELNPSRTNWQYLRAMPAGEARQTFAAFTRIFDHKWYGHEPTTLEDYGRCRELADWLCARDAA